MFLTLVLITNIYAGISLSDFLETSSKMIGTKYQFSPRSDIEPGELTDPNGHSANNSATDCFVFINEVLSKLYNIDVNLLRYKKKPYNWFNRIHFIETDWLEKTKSFLKEYTIHGETLITTQNRDEAAWFLEQQKQATSLNPAQIEAFSSQIRIQHQPTITLSYLPWSSIFENNEIKSSFRPFNDKKWAIALFVRNNYPKNASTNIAISHMAFIWDNNGVVTIRQASSLYGSVFDMPLKFMNFEEEKYNKIKNPSYLGLLILQPQDVRNIAQNLKH